MEAVEIRSILDGLDKRLALGEIDLGTYNQLKAKYSEMLTTTKEPISVAVDAISKEAKALKCPGCMAPLPMADDPGQTSLICEYCGGTFTIKAAQDELERLRNDIRKWIYDIAGNVGIGTTVDEASRRFIFKEQLFPSLATEVARSIEIYHLLRYQPLFTFPLLNHIGSSPFHITVQSTPSLNYLVDKVKNAVARAQSPEMAVFAIGEKEKSELYKLEMRCQEAIFLSNMRHHLLSFTPDGIQKVQNNIQGLISLYEKINQYKSSIEPSLLIFISSFLIRLREIDEAITILKSLLKNTEAVMIDHISNNLDAIALRLEQTIAKIESSGIELKEQVPAIEGTRIDAQSVRLLAFSVRLFGYVGGEAGQSFSQFLEDLGRIVESAKDPRSDLTWLSNFLAHISLHVGGEDSGIKVMVISNVAWAKDNTKRSNRSPSVTEEQVYVPFWMAELSHSKQTGVFSKTGKAALSLCFLEASRHNGSCFAIPSSDAISKQCYNAPTSSQGIGPSTPAIVPIVSSDRALSIMKQYISSTKAYAGAHVKLMNLVYLPAVAATYPTRKKEGLEILNYSKSLNVDRFMLKKARLGVRELTLLQ